MTGELGSDFSCTDDLDPNWGVVSGTTCLGQALYRRLTTKRGALWYDPNYGTDIRQYLNSSTPINVIGQAVENECRKDERVEDVEAFVETDAAGETYTIAVRVTAADAPFSLTILATSLTVELLEISEAA